MKVMTGGITGGNPCMGNLGTPACKEGSVPIWGIEKGDEMGNTGM